jgi:hypothetical protein
MGKSSAPPPPDYAGAAQQQGEASKEVTNMQNWANRPNQYSPFGSQTWSTQATTDPATGQQVTQWNQNTSLNPNLQQALDSQINTQRDRSQLAGGFMDRVKSEYAQPFNWGGLPERAGTSNLSGQVQTGLGSNAPALPQFDSGYRDRVANTLMERMVPVHEVHDLTVDGPSVQRELALFKVAGKGEARIEALRLAEIFRANVVDSTLESFIFEMTGTPEKIDAFAELMRPLGLMEIARTGVAALSRGV